MEDVNQQAAAAQADPDTVGNAAMDIATLRASHDDQAGRLSGLAEGLDALGYAVPADGDATAVALSALSELKAEHAKLASDHEKLTKKVAQAKPSGEKGRNIGPIKHPVEAREDESGTVSAVNVLLEKIRDAGLVELAFSDGKREISELPALTISGEDAWAITAAGLALKVEPMHLISQGRPVVIRGYGLLLDGKLTAYRETGPHHLAAGQQWSVAGDVVFTG